MKKILLPAWLLLGLSLVTGEDVRADEVTAQITLPASREPARVNDPPCGDPNDITKADVALQGSTAAADAYIGYPVVSTSLEALPEGTDD